MNEKYMFGGLFLLLIVGFIGLWTFFARDSAGAPSVQPVKTFEAGSAPPFQGKRILYVDSYHAGYDWSDGVTKGIETSLEGAGIELKIVRMDTKQNPSEEFKLAAGLLAKQEIDVFKPDVLIVSDDNAFKYVVQAYYRDAALPVVFSGLNWDAGVYGAPYRNTTGMVEVSLTPEITKYLQEYAAGGRLGFLSADNETERKNVKYYEQLFGLKFAKVYYAKSMSEWKEAFSKLQREVDYMIFENSAGVLDWNEAEAEQYALANTKIPVGTTNEWTMKESLLGITKVPEEQGAWSAEAAKRILSGASPSEIPLVKNKSGKLFVNLKIADVLGVKFAPNILKNAEITK